MGRIDNNAAIAHQMILNDQIHSLPKVVRLAWSRFIVGLLIRSPASVGFHTREVDRRPLCPPPLQLVSRSH
jgi:hypothetical protein